MRSRAATWLVGGRWTIIFVATAVAAAGASLLDVTYSSPVLNAALTTAHLLLAFSVTYLLFLRFGRTHGRSDLLLLHAISIIGFAQVFFNPYTGIHLKASEVSPTPLLTCYFFAATTMAAAVLVQGHKARGRMGLVLLSTGLAAAIPLIATMLDEVGATGKSIAAPVSQSSGDLMRAAVVYVLLIAAGAGFCALRNRSSDPFFGWVTAASATAAFVLASPFVAPTLGSGFTDVNDLLMLVVLILFFIACQPEMALKQDEHTKEAALNERRRLARELHDGITQELVFIASRGNTLLKRTTDDAGDGLRQMTSAAERAADEARQAILTLTRQNTITTGEAIQELASELTHRSGLVLNMDVDPAVQVGPAATKELQGILREALANAANHGKASAVGVRLRRGNGLILEISDDGQGFDHTEIEQGRSGFGFISMQERAHVLGGTLQVWSSPGQGAKVSLTADEDASVVLT